MLTEHFVASISASTKPNTGITKDAGIFFHEFQPLAAQRHVFKKSITDPHCLAVGNSHIFAAQAEKAVVHVYSREKGNQEAIVPFPERIHSIALASKDTVLLLGTESGRILAWEVCSGRLVSTSTSHLQPVTTLSVDPTSNFFLSGSTDSMIHVWALPNILSFSPDTSRSPIHTLSTHRSPITTIICGHSSSNANIAISTSQDKSAIVWDYRNGIALRTYLLPETPTALALDPADQAFYVAYEDGSLQTVSFFDEAQQSTPTNRLHDTSLSHHPTQPPIKTRFNAESQKLGNALSLGLSWDGTTLISGHASGKVAVWDLAKRNYISTLATLPGPITNLQFLHPTGFPNTTTPKFKIHAVVKPKHDTGLIESGSGLVPAAYGLNVQLTGQLSVPAISAADSRKEKSEFERALTHPSFPSSMLEESLAELEGWSSQPNGSTAPSAPSAATADFLSFDGAVSESKEGVRNDGKDEELKELKKQLASLQRVQTVTFDQLAELRKEKEWLMKKEKKRAKRKEIRTKKRLGLVNGDGDGDVEMSEGSLKDGSTESDSDSNEDGSSSSDNDEASEERSNASSSDSD
ncbi:WD40 repeat-like protein [Zopfia rhizophila CBS 207.26]|uniref:Pre-rRNA-processing protein IPI3 n=1 Tax=Zopfia rhizophila CBS 207.26 TaxID=1314779 RepID=A0A6A6EPE9_9PEZI|nr:WD40 repeat-like protein [Zopfia rhizophila CBS 207.26]